MSTEWVIDLQELKYPRGGVALRDVRLESDGSSLVCYGPNASGKTSLGWLLLGLIPKVIPAHVDGTVRWPSGNGRAPRRGLVPQNVDAAFLSLRVGDEISSRDKMSEDILKSFRVLDFVAREPWTLSYGEQQRVAIAAEIARGADVLVLDEPTAGLDAFWWQELESLLKLLGEEKRQVVTMTHDWRLLRLFPRVVRLRQGRIVEDRPVTEEVVAERKETAGRRFGEAKRRKRQGQPLPTGQSIISAASVDFSFRRNQKLLRAISLTVRSGEIVGLVGLNGSGKTTLLEILAGLRKPSNGLVKFCGDEESIWKLTPAERTRRITLVYQNPDRQIFARDLREELTFAPRNLGFGEEETRKRVESALQLFGFSRPEVSPFALSYGRRKALTLAAAISIDPDVYLLDEPQLGLDEGWEDQLATTMVMLAREKEAGIIVASHDTDFLTAVADRVLWLRNGELREVREGEVDSLRERLVEEGRQVHGRTEVSARRQRFTARALVVWLLAGSCVYFSAHWLVSIVGMSNGVVSFVSAGGLRARVGQVVAVSLGVLILAGSVLVTASGGSMQELRATAVVLGKWAAVGLAGIAFLLTVSMAELPEALRWYRLPRALHLGVSAGLAFIPFTLRETERVVSAQRARGAGVREWWRMLGPTGLRTLISIVAPIVAGVARRLQDFLIAAELRGWVDRERRERLEWTKADSVLVCGSILYMLLVFLL